MLRIVLLNILLFSLPFLAYAGYVLLTRNANDPSSWDNVPILWLLAAGFALLFIGMVTLVHFESAEPGGKYHPPAYEDGEIRPGYFE